MSKRRCGRCGKDPAEGLASVWTAETGEVFYCHGDDDDVSCYEKEGRVGCDCTELCAMGADVSRWDAGRAVWFRVLANLLMGCS